MARRGERRCSPIDRPVVEPSILLVAVAIYAVIEHVRRDLSEAEFVDAFVGGGLLAIGHAVHQGARKLSCRD
jgi:predicted RNA methylase